MGKEKDGEDAFKFALALPFLLKKSRMLPPSLNGPWRRSVVYVVYHAADNEFGIAKCGWQI